MSDRIHITDDEFASLVDISGDIHDPAIWFSVRGIYLARRQDGSLISDWVLPLLKGWRGVESIEGVAI